MRVEAYYNGFVGTTTITVASWCRESAENRSKFAAYKVTKFLLDDIKPQYYWYRGYVLLLSLSICVVSVYIYDVFDRLVVAFTLVCGKFLLVSYIWYGRAFPHYWDY